MDFKKVAAIVAAAGALTALAIPAMAEITPYGSARMATFYNFQDIKTGTGQTAGFDEHLQSNSRFGVDYTGGVVTGKVELGTGVNVRLLYGTWDFGAGTLVVGQDYNNYYLGSAQTHLDDNGNNGYGALWDTRQPQVKVNLKNGLYLSLIQATGNVNGDQFGANAEATSGLKMYMPKLNVGYKGKAGAVDYNAGVVGTTFKNVAAGKDVFAYLGYASGTATFGATSLVANISGSQNAGNLGFLNRVSYDATNKKDSIGFEGYVQVTQKLSDMFSANLGFGYLGDKVDVTNKDKFDDRMLIFVNAPITLAKNVVVTPEVSYYDQLKDNTGANENKKAYAVGAQWKISF